MVLTKLGHHNEAAAAFLLSLHLGGGEQSVYRLLCEVISDNNDRSGLILSYLGTR